MGLGDFNCLALDVDPRAFRDWICAERNRPKCMDGSVVYHEVRAPTEGGSCTVLTVPLVHPFSRVLDVIFFVDMILQFFIAYQLSDNYSSVMYSSDHPKIVVHYLCTWFPLDITTVIVPLAMDLYVALMEDGQGSDRLASRISVVRMFRLVRVVKLVRLVRAQRIYKRWKVGESRFSGLHDEDAAHRCDRAIARRAGQDQSELWGAGGYGVRSVAPFLLPLVRMHFGS